MQKVGQYGGSLSIILEPLLKIGKPLMTNMFKPLAKGVLIPLGLPAAVSVIDAAIQKKDFDYTDNLNWRNE